MSTGSVVGAFTTFTKIERARPAENRSIQESTIMAYTAVGGGAAEKPRTAGIRPQARRDTVRK
jgi:hypothetical protein